MAIDRNEIVGHVQELVAIVRPDLQSSEIQEASSLGTLGLDSVNLVELGVRLEQIFGNTVVLDNWIDQEAARGADGYTVGSLVDFIQKSLAN